ncbi:MAG: hypothetical protein CYPHOPRED_003367 [Cyphobasidiales sp. Tagirdzhanova-0007]|nr:MAG: hypothetical protein CYPHOPRED_003367 [Cyphobasidiales sp. Tagirdzhanova-0007]
MDMLNPFYYVFASIDGYVVIAPVVFHEFTGPDALAYDTAGTDKGNDYKVRKLLTAYCAFDPRVLASCCFFPTDIHDEKLGSPGPSDSMERCKEIKGELLMILGVHDTHVDLAGRNAIRGRLSELPTAMTWLEVQAGHAFIRDELSKGL